MDISVTIRIIYTIIRLDLLLKSFFLLVTRQGSTPPHCENNAGLLPNDRHLEKLEAANLTNRTPKKCLPLREVSLRKMAWKLRDHWFNDSGLISCNGVEMGKHYLSGLNFFSTDPTPKQVNVKWIDNNYYMSSCRWTSVVFQTITPFIVLILKIALQNVPWNAPKRSIETSRWGDGR